jgi:hypothetical protein
LTAAERRCGHCGAFIPEAETSCPKCGRHPIQKKTTEPIEQPQDEERTTKRASLAAKLVKLFLQSDPELFNDQHRVPYVRVAMNGVLITLPIRSRKMRSLLARMLWEAEEKAPGGETLNAAINVLSARALFDGKQYTLYTRIAPGNDGIWIDMADARWRAIHVTAHGWTIVDNPPIVFRRHHHMQPLCIPIRNGDPWRLLAFLNIGTRDADTRLMLMVLVGSYWIPEIAHLILVLYGIQGSAKSTTMRLIRSLVDPSSVGLLALPRGERERVQQLAHHWLAFYDNLTRLDTWTSDTLCRAATGGGFTKRELYTDDSDVIYNFRRCVGLNGINVAAQRGDLLDRSLLVELHAIPDTQRRAEDDLLTAFEAEKPAILGGFLDALVEAMRIYPTVQLHSLYRMADFCKWGCAIAQALDSTPEAFLAAYRRKNRVQVEEAAHSSPVATVLLAYMQTRYTEWRGTPTQLYTDLQDYAKILKISTRQRAWPKAPHILIRYLNELIPALQLLGFTVETGIHTGTQREVIITPNTVSSVSTVTADAPANAANGTNASPPTSQGRDATRNDARRDTLSERIKAYVRVSKSVGCVRAAQDLGIPLATFLAVGAAIHDLLFDRERATVSWRPSFLDDVLQTDLSSSLDDAMEGS